MILKKIKNRATGWRPLVLHWRRRTRDRRPMLKVGRATSRVSISYFPHVHLHFTTHVSNQNHRSAVQRIFSATTVYRERVLLDRRFETRINTNSVTRALHAQPTRINYTNAGRFSKHVSIYASLKQSALIHKIHQSRARASFLSVFTTRQNTNRQELIQTLKEHSHLREHEHRSQLFSFRSTSHENRVKTSRTQFHRAEELVWRDAPVPTVAQTTNQNPVDAPTVSTHAQTASSSSSSTQIPQQQITKLDPGLVDRLTDDVIRRVEKRARIERQRRGL
jgi:hypothetical protein